MNLSAKSLNFIKENVLPQLKIDQLTPDHLQDVVDYISDNFEIPLAQAKESGETIDEALLALAAAVITEITTSPDW